MAELILQVGNSGGYSDGDIIHAFNDEFISRNQLESICHPERAPRVNGYLQSGDYIEEWYKKTYQYKFERISTDTVRRTIIATREFEDFNATPNAKGEAVDVPLWIERRKNNRNHQLFGSGGAEVWYGGKQDFSDLSTVWTKVTNATGKTQQPLSQLSESVYREYLVLKVDDFDNATRGELESPQYDLTDPDNPVMVQKRKNFVSIDDLTPANLGTSRVNINDKRQKVEVRGQGLLRANIVTTKNG